VLDPGLPLWMTRHRSGGIRDVPAPQAPSPGLETRESGPRPSGPTHAPRPPKGAPRPRLTLLDHRRGSLDHRRGSLDHRRGPLDHRNGATGASWSTGVRCRRSRSGGRGWSRPRCA
jgi:hypothetical protein